MNKTTEDPQILDVNDNGISKVLAVVHDDEVLSDFGDDDALLSVAPKAVEVSSVSESQRSGKITSRSTMSLKSSELRDQNSLERRLIFEDDPLPSHPGATLDFESMGLIARETQTATLRACFDRIRNESTTELPEDEHKHKELLLVAGESGCGKTSTVKTLEKHMKTAEVGLFAEGKFEMNLSDEPYSGISKAISEMCQKTKTGTKAESIRERLSNTLHDDEAQLLVPLVPGLVEILSLDLKGDKVSRELDVDELESGNERLKHAFRLLIRAFCDHFRPLVLFLDDLQWADVSSLQAIDSILSDTENESPLVIIGAYRSDEVDENSLLHNKILALRDKSSTCHFHITEMEVPVFDRDDVVAAIKAIFTSVAEEESRALADLCVKRTLGNPFFVLEFLKMLYHEGLVEFIESNSTWSWDLTKIEDASMSTANVVVLLQDRMKRLSKYAQMFLRCAALLGSIFRQDALEIVWKSHGMPMTVGDKPILPLLIGMAVKDSFVEKYGLKMFRWVHDKLQEAALSLLEDVMVSQFDVGRILYYSLQTGDLQHDLFAVVDLLNSGNTEKKPEFARANLRAAEKAMGLSAFKSAASYAAHGIDLVKDSDWSTDRNLKLNLYSIGADAELVLGNAETAEQYIEEVLNRGDFSPLETLSLTMTKVKAMSSIQMRFDDAIDYCLKVLKDLDFAVTCNRRFVPIEAPYAAMKTIRRLKKVPKDFYKQIGVITDPKQKAIVAWTATLNYIAYSADDHMLAMLAACKIVKMTLKYGLSEYSGESVASIGAAANFLKQDYSTVQRFMDLALSIQATVGRAKLAKTTQVAYVYGIAWTRKMSDAIPHMSKGYTVGMQLGETTMATWNLVFARVLMESFLGRPLDQMKRTAPKVLSQVEEVGQHGQAVVTRLFWQMFINLSDSSISQNTTLEGEVWSSSHRNSAEKVFYPPTSYMAQVFLYVIFSDYEAAGNLALEKGDFYPKTVPGIVTIMGETFHRAIALYAAARKTKKRKFKTAANKLRKRITGWEKAGNPNVKHHVLFLDAELAALNNKKEQAKTKYLDAITVASQGGFLQYVALFNERYSDYLSQQPTLADEAEKRRGEAIRAYKEWGAHAKVAKMMEAT